MEKLTKNHKLIWYKRKNFMIMKNIVLLFFMSTATLIAENSYAQNTKLSLTLTDADLKEVLQEIRQNTEFTILFRDSDVEPVKNLNYEFRDAVVTDILDKCLSGTFLSYEIKDKVIVIHPVESRQVIQVQNDKIEITGIVTEENGAPIPGANVYVKGTSLGTMTGTDGRYTLKAVPPDAVIVFSFVGYKTVEVPVEGRTQINVQLLEDITAIGEVVINAGYYTVKEQERTGSIVKITAKEIQNQPVSNVLSAVEGRMAGVNIIQGGGTPGGGYNVQIRGINSLRKEGNYPMYIIDGIPITTGTPSYYSATIIPSMDISPLNAINPNDIESIEVLKDADATAIYGSRGSNGVILITTKRVKAGNKTAFSVNGSYGISSLAGKMDLLNTTQYLEMRRQAYANDGITTYPASAYDVNGAWDQSRYTNWQQKLIGRYASSSTEQLTVSGGNENTGFIISGNHSEQGTVFSKDFNYKTNNLSGSLIHHSTDNRFTLKASGIFSDQSNNLIQTDITTQTLLLSPNAPALYNEDGNLNWEDNTFENPVAAYVSTYLNNSKTLNVDINADYEIFPSVSIKFNGGFNQQSFEEFSLSPNTMYNPAYGITTENSSAFRGTQQLFSYLLEPQLNYRHKFKNHEIDVLAGGTIQQRKSSTQGLAGYGFESNSMITNLSAASDISVSRDIVSEYKYAAIFGRINYQYKNRYIINLTGRCDGSSRFGPNNRYANFGAIGIAWLFSKENFLADKSWISFGKLRSSYGITGSDLIGDYQYLDTYTVSSNIYSGGSTLYPSRLYNPDFSWEKTCKFEAAVDLGFLNDRIKFTAAWYMNRSGNQLVGIPLPRTTGFSSIQANLPATVENSGLELELGASPVKTGNFQWNTGFNVSFPKNKLVSFPGLEGSTYANKYVIGYPITITKVYNYEGIDPATGLFKFTDYNEDGTISSPSDNKVIESIGISCFGGWSNQLSYNNWDLSFLMQFVMQKQSNYISQMFCPGTFNNQPAEVLNVWSETNTDGKYMPYTSGANSQKMKLFTYYKSSTASVGDASFIRLKNIRLSYKLVVKKYMQDIQFYIQGQNLLTITNYFGLDPEFISAGFLPPLKTWSFGIQLNF
jgi:TonB-linked SusC/RagA family outer membrane protein